MFYAMRSYCHLSAREVTELPPWEFDLLLEGINNEKKERAEEV